MGGRLIRKLRNYFFTGLLVIVPLVVTAFILWRLFIHVDGYLGPLLVRYTGRSIPGLGFIATIFVILFIGLFASNLIGRRLIGIGEYILHKIPFVNKIYMGVKQISSVLFREEKRFFQQVVAVEYPRKGVWALAFLTSYLPTPVRSDAGRKVAAVFLPTTPNPTSGFLLLLPVEDVHEVDMNVEEGIKFVISGGAVLPPGRGTLAKPTGDKVDG